MIFELYAARFVYFCLAMNIFYTTFYTIYFFMIVYYTTLCQGFFMSKKIFAIH